MSKGKKRGIYQVYINHIRYFWTWYSDGTVAAYTEFPGESMQPTGIAAENVHTADDWKRFKATAKLNGK